MTLCQQSLDFPVLHEITGTITVNKLYQQVSLQTVFKKRNQLQQQNKKSVPFIPSCNKKESVSRPVGGVTLQLEAL